MYRQNINSETTKLLFGSPNSKKILDVPFSKAVHKYRPYSVKTTPIACFTLLKPEDLIRENFNQFIIKKSVIKELRQINDNRPIVISNYLAWLSEILNRENKRKYHLYGKPVKYYSDNEPFPKLNLKSFPSRILFYKNERFKKQREYRLLLDESINSKGKAIDFGDFSRFSYKLNSLDDLLDSGLIWYK